MLKKTCFNDSIKVSIIGYPAVGKTTMAKMISQRGILKKYIPTAGFDLKTIKFGAFTLKLWDFGGQEKYRQSYLETPKLLANTSILVFVLDLHHPENFDIANEYFENVYSVYPFTGTPDNNGWLEGPDGQLWQSTATPEQVELYKKRMKNPFNYGPPRQIRLGLRFEI